MRISALILVLLAAPASAQEADIQKQLIQRQQQSDAFSLQLQQSQEAIKAPLAARPALERRQLSERQRLDNVSQKQLLEVKPETPQALRAYEREKADRERRRLAIPSGGIIRPE